MNTQLINITEIARETIKRLALARLAPTPDNYLRIYNEIANIPEQKTLLGALKKTIKKRLQQAGQKESWLLAWDNMLATESWQDLPSLFDDTLVAKAQANQIWPTTIRTLLKVWTTSHTGLTQERKKETLDRVLNNFGQQAELPNKIMTMIESWLQYGTEAKSSQKNHALEQSESTRSESTRSEPAQALAMVSASERTLNTDAQASEDAILKQAFNALQDMLKQALNHGLIPRLEGYPELLEDANRLLQATQNAHILSDWQALSLQLKSLLLQVAMLDAEEIGVKNDLLNLLKLLIDNIGELVSDDQWLKGQVALVKTVISGPIEKEMLVDAKRSLKEVIYKQSLLKNSLAEAKSNFKKMIAIFIERLSSISDTTGQYHSKIESYAENLSQTDDISQINHIVEGLMSDTRTMQVDILRSREAILTQQDQAIAAEKKIQELEVALTDLGEKVRIDQLTGVLNRRGLDESFKQEIARAQRGNYQLSVAMLDIDNFKQLNDAYGHEAGDGALQHLANLIKETIRPVDIVARFGGEEFVILLPDTDMKQASAVIQRLQRALTKMFYMHNNERLLVTFSAGLALLGLDETNIEVLHRADKAMYMAKQAGKNRVITENELH